MRVFPLATGARPFSAVFHFVAQAVQPAGGGGGGGAPTTADYLVGTADATLSNEIVVGATPGGELGGTWASPTVDAVHSGSSHAATQAAAEATAAAALAAHLAVDVIDGDAAGGVLSGTYPNPGFAVDMATQAELNTHESDTTSVHGITDTSVLMTSTQVATEIADQKRVVELLVSDPNGSAITTGDGKAHFFVPNILNGHNLVDADAAVTTVSSSGTPTIQIANVTQAADMLSTRITIDANEKTSYTAAAAPVIDTGNDDVATGDELRVDVDVAGTGAKGLCVILTFEAP